MQVELDLVQPSDERPNLPVDLIQLLVRVAPHHAASVVQELAGTEVARGVQSVHEALHHDDLSVLQVDLVRMIFHVTVQSELDRWLMLRLQLSVFLKVELPVDLKESIIDDLNFVRQTELHLMTNCVSAAHIFLPDRS